MLSLIAADSANIATPESEKSFSEWSADSPRNPARRVEQHAVHLRQSSHVLDWWWTNHRKLLARVQWELLAGTSGKKTRQFSDDSDNQNALPYWSWYILWTVFGEHKNQPPKTKTTGRHLRQGGSSLKTAPAVIAFAQMTGTQTDKPQSRCLWSTPFPKAHPTKDQVDGRWSGAWSFPPMIIAGKIQLNPCPILERAATVESTEFVISSRCLRVSRWNSLFDDELPIFNLVESCLHPRPSQRLFIGNWRKVRLFCQHVLFLLLHKRQPRSLPNLLEKAVSAASQLTKWMVSIIICCLGVNKFIGDWNRTYVTDIGKATITHSLLWRVNIQPKMEYGTNVEQYRCLPRNVQRADPEPLRRTCIIMRMMIAYRFPEEDETAWISCEQADRGRDTRPYPSSK